MFLQLFVSITPHKEHENRRGEFRGRALGEKSIESTVETSLVNLYL